MCYISINLSSLLEDSVETSKSPKDAEQILLSPSLKIMWLYPMHTHYSLIYPYIILKRSGILLKECATNRVIQAGDYQLSKEIIQVTELGWEYQIRIHLSLLNTKISLPVSESQVLPRSIILVVVKYKRYFSLQIQV